MKSRVTYCSPHLTDTCSSNDSMIDGNTMTKVYTKFEKNKK